LADAFDFAPALADDRGAQEESLCVNDEMVSLVADQP
jgi:hypothetical protein